MLCNYEPDRRNAVGYKGSKGCIMSDGGNSNEKLSDLEILKNRIYPAIQSCVKARYYIIVGIFAFYSFILTSNVPSITTNFDCIKLYGSIMFTLFTFLNSYNYCRNSGEQYSIEKKNESDSFGIWLKRNDIELIFFILAVSLIWGFFLLIKKDC